MLPRECFKYDLSSNSIREESPERFELEKIDFETVPKLYIKGGMFPLKGFPSPEALSAINIIKSHLIDTLKVLAKWYFIPGLILTALSTRKLEELLISFNRSSLRVIQGYIYKYHHLSEFGQQLQFAIFTFLVNLGITEKTADKTSEIITHLFEYDNAYRLRTQDILSETSLEKLSKPQREITRLLKIQHSRDCETVNNKTKLVGLLLKILLVIPKYRKAYKETLKAIDLSKLQYETDDIYWVCFKEDYNWMGLTHSERKEYAKTFGWTYPEYKRDEEAYKRKVEAKRIKKLCSQPS